MSGQQYDNNLRGALWQNDVPKRHEKAPDFSGHVEIDGVKYHVDMWDTGADRPRPYFSMKLQNFDEWQAERERYKQGRGEQGRTNTRARPSAQRAVEPPAEQPDFDDDIPW